MTTKLQPPVGTVIETGEEAITIPAGEMSWEEWQGHLDAMSARDGVTLVCNPGEYVDCSGIQVSIADLFVPHPFPITFQQDFTYTPVYPLEPCTTTEGIDDLEALAKGAPHE